MIPDINPDAVAGALRGREDLQRDEQVGIAYAPYEPIRCPTGLRDRTWSQRILNIAKRGTASRAPGMPQIVCQKNRDTITRTGFRVKRLANSMGVIVSPSAMWISR